MPAPSELCIALRNWRIRARLQQDAVARTLGVTQSQVSRWESGRDAPRPHNIEAIRRLIWGPEADPLIALRYFVEESHQNLLLMDANRTVIARSKPLKPSPGPLDRFGWVLDPVKNPAFAPAHSRFCELLRARRASSASRSPFLSWKPAAIGARRSPRPSTPSPAPAYAWWNRVFARQPDSRARKSDSKRSA